LSRGRWALILHGGAKPISPERAGANRSGCLAALEAGRAVLEGGGTALAAVEAVIRVLEDDPTFNAGFGSVLTAEGRVEMDAALMDGTALDIGAVAAVEGVRHPVSVARLMLREPSTLLVAEGARRFAANWQAELCPPEAMISREQLASEAQGHDTVGCVALDHSGAIAAGTATGGLAGTLPGRIGDSPLPGCGFYADDGIGAVTFSGDGEAIARTMLAARVVGRLEAGEEPHYAHALAVLERTGGEAGGIALDRQGRVGWAHSPTTDFAVTWMTSDMTAPRVSLNQKERQSEEPDRAGS
jgi:beta-aspartyl-peptidase (threonine type)